MKKLTIISLLLLLHAYCLGDTRIFSVADGLPTNQIRQIVQLPNRQMLVVTECGASLLNGKEFVEQPCDLDSIMTLPRFGTYAYMWQGDSLLWLKDFYSLYIYNVRKRAFQYDYQKRIEAPEIRHFIEENGDSLTHALIDRSQAVRNHFTSVTAGTDLQGTWMQTFCRDNQGGLWMGTQNDGILYERPPHPMTTVTQLPDGMTVQRMADIGEGRLLIATFNGLYLFNRTSAALEKHLLQSNMSCMDMSTDKDGRVWICTTIGLYCYDHSTLTLYDAHNTTGLLHSRVRFSLPLSDGRLLLCNLQNELGYFDIKTRHFDRLNESIADLYSYRTMIAASPLNRPDLVAVCTQNGLFVLDVSKNQVERLDNQKVIERHSRKFTCICRDQRGRVWLGTPSGLLCLLPEGDEYTLRRLTKADGLPNNSIQSVTEDSRGNIWVGTAMGVCRINVTNTSTVYTLPLSTSDGLPPTEMTERGICPTSDGYVYFASDMGLVSLRAEDFNRSQPELGVEIVGLQIAGTQLQPSDSVVVLKHSENDLTIQFSALNYATPEATRYRFRLVGAEGSWNYENGKDGLLSLSYFALRPDTYQFQVQAQIGVGEWGPLTNLYIRVLPPLWLTWWAKLIYALLLISVALLLLHLYLHNRKKKIERDNEERINRLFELRDEARRQFALSARVDASKLTADTSEESELVAKLTKAITDNLDNPDYTVDMMASDLAMSRASLYKKTSTMLGISPNDFMRNIRLKHSENLLGETTLTIAEIAQRVGFGSARYFSQCFRQVYGVTPSEYRGDKE